MEFWIVDPESTSVAVYSQTAGVHVYRADEPVPLAFLSSALNSIQIWQ
jgi:hypothetical protein